MPKNHELRVKLSLEEYQQALKKIKNSGMKISDYVRYLLRTANLKITLEE